MCESAIQLLFHRHSNAGTPKWFESMNLFQTTGSNRFVSLDLYPSIGSNRFNLRFQDRDTSHAQEWVL